MTAQPAIDLASAAGDAISLDARSPVVLVRGAWRPARGTIIEDQYDPSTGRVTGHLTHASLDDVDEAVAASLLGASVIASETQERRLERVAALRGLLAADRTTLVALITHEAGKTLTQAARELDLADAFLAWLADPASWPTLTRSRTAEVERRPIGVAAGISLYHYSVLSPLWMAVPALAAGNGYVLRPCTWSPVTGAEVGRLIALAFPEPAFNLVQGGIEVVDRFLAHPDLRAISYVGSGPWARYMYEHGTATGKRVQSMGALRQVHHVLAGADLDRAADAITRGVTDYAGQRWLAGSSVVADPAIADDLVERLAARLRTVRVGRAGDPGSEMGPVVRRERRDDLVTRMGATASADLVVDGRRTADDEGYFLILSLVDRQDASSAWWVNETPGPVVSLFRADRAEAARLLSGAPRGLVGTIHGADADAVATAQAVPFSIVAVNGALGELEAGLPFAAWQPGFLGDHVWNGPDQMHFFTQPRVTIR